MQCQRCFNETANSITLIFSEPPNTKFYFCCVEHVAQHMIEATVTAYTSLTDFDALLNMRRYLLSICNTIDKCIVENKSKEN